MMILVRNTYATVRAPMVSLRAYVASVLILGVVQASCTLVGAGLGAGVDSTARDRYKSLSPAELDQVDRGTRLRVYLGDGGRIDGTLVYVSKPGTSGRLDRDVLLDCDGRELAISETRIEHIEIDVAGKGWLYGALAGALVDATIITFAAVRYESRADP